MAYYFYGNPYRPQGAEAARALEKALAPYHQKVYADPWLAEQGVGEGCEGVPLLPPGNVKAVVCFGGDGTLLRAAPEAVARGLPLLGVHTGRVGFLMAGSPDDPVGLARLLEEDACFSVSCPMLEVRRGPRRYLCLNEVSLTRGLYPGAIETRVVADGEEVFSAHGDGAILATPLGAAAYALSAGGPVIHPDLSCLLAVPLCPQERHLRPVLLPATAQISLWTPGAHRHRLLMSMDGQWQQAVAAEAAFHVSLAREKVTLLFPRKPAFFHTLRQKQAAWSPSESEE